MIEYIVGRYDKEGRVSLKPGTNKHYTQFQWSVFYVSAGELVYVSRELSMVHFNTGPNFGRVTWFKSEKILSVIERFECELTY